MAVSDRWHRSPGPGDGLCEHRLAPTSRHGVGKRWLVRWRDDTGAQRKQAFERKAEAERFERQVRTQLDSGTYVDPNAGRVTFRDYAEQWRAGLTSDPHTRTNVESRLRVHVYPALGDVELAVLARRPSRMQQWIAGMEADLAPSTIKGVVATVATILSAAVDDMLITRNPLHVSSITLPRTERPKIVPWTLAQVEAMADALGSRHAGLVIAGAGCGLRQGELFGLALDDVDFLRRIEIALVPDA